jgi:hypothetical protein
MPCDLYGFFFLLGFCSLVHFLPGSSLGVCHRKHLQAQGVLQGGM